ncbi:MAG: hypothetical protein JSU96_14175, partial [Acidobacteriota bacterium]
GVLLGSGDVETNSATELSVFVPPGVKGSELQVEAAGRTSNLYKVSIPFRPWAAVSLSDTSAGADAALTLSVEQESSELAPLAIAVHSEGGEWITAGHEVGSVIGTVTSRLLSPSGIELGDGGWIDLVVESSDSERMILYGLDTEDPDSDPSLVIEATTTGYGVMLIAPFGEYSELSFELPGTLSMQIDFTEPVFRNPSAVAGQSDITLTLWSTPEMDRLFRTVISNGEGRSQ